MFDLGRQSPAAADWSPQQYESLFASSGQRLPEHLALVAENEIVEDESGLPSEGLVRATPLILGFLVARRVDSEWELENIVVAESDRRRGVGRFLLTQLAAHAQAAGGSAMFLEVRESNGSARALYRKMGFEETGLRKNYYAGPAESAVLYRLRLS